MNKLFALAIAGLVFSACNAHSQDLSTKTTVSVGYGDLDIDHAAGAGVLVQRIGVAARDACGPSPDMREIRAHADYEACVRTATDKAVDAVKSPMVTAMAGRGPVVESVASK